MMKRAGSFFLLNMVFFTACNVDKKTADGLVVGGKPADNTMVKASTVALFREGKPACSGVIVSEKYILTAQHCFLTENDPAKFEIVSGADLSAPDIQRRKVRTIHTYANDRDGVPVRTFLPVGDIAAVEWEGGPLAGMEPAAVADDDFVMEEGSTLLLSGYGVASAYDTTPNFLLKEGETLLQKVYREGPFRGLITFGKGAAGTCFGDSGGPAFLKDKDGRWVLVGLTQGASATLNSDGDFISTNDACSLKVGIHTMVSFYASWLKALGIPLVGRFSHTLDQPSATAASWQNLCENRDLDLQSSYDIRRIMMLVSKDADCKAVESKLSAISEIRFAYSAPSNLDLVRFLPAVRKISLLRITTPVSLQGLSSIPGLDTLILDGTREVKDQKLLADATSLKTLSWVMVDRMAKEDYPEAEADAFARLPVSLETLALMRIRLKSLDHLPATLRTLTVTGAGLESANGLGSAKQIEFLDLSNNKLSSLPVMDDFLRVNHAVFSANDLKSMPYFGTLPIVLIADENPAMLDTP